MRNDIMPADLIGYDTDDVQVVLTRDAYGIFHDVDDGSFVTVQRRRAAVVVSTSDGSRNPGQAVVNLSGLDAAKLSGALTAAAIDALTWEEQNR